MATRIRALQAQATLMGWETHFSPTFIQERKLAVVFGWSHSQHKHVTKYSKEYADLGYSTVQIVPAESNIDLNRAWRIQTVQMLTSLISDAYLVTESSIETAGGDEGMTFTEKEYAGKPVSVVIHAMSNGGLGFYTQLLEECRKDAELHEFWSNCLSGVVLDSAPAQLNLSSLGHAMTSHIRSRLQRTLTFYMVTFMAFVGYIATCCSYGEENVGFNLLRDSPLHLSRPVLFIYGKESVNITDDKWLADFIAEQEAAGMDVTSVYFEESTHVMHLRLHTDAYREALSQFVSRL